jgi:hypothetical protein
MLQFPYQAEILGGPAPPSLPPGILVRYRPLVPIVIVGPTGLMRQFPRAVVDPAADDTVFPLDTAARIGARLRPDSGHRVRWRGQLHPLRFGDVELILADAASTCVGPLGLVFPPLHCDIRSSDRPARLNSSMYDFSELSCWRSWKPTLLILAHAKP